MRDLFPEAKLFVEHPVSKGYFCDAITGAAASEFTPAAPANVWSYYVTPGVIVSLTFTLLLYYKIILFINIFMYFCFLI
ncbi:hypothetical protein, partial [Bacteroides sp. 519]|uniref:hypothetical protein n=1 Tax=Bacteroides sp. 519 TaxID=2302937 RepID=UPI001940279C